MKKVRLDLLEEVISIIKKVKPSQWNMDIWKSHITEDFGDGVVHSCGTVGCAIGHAASSPVFKKLGLRFEYDYSFEIMCPILKRGGVRYDYFDAVAKIFNLDVGDAVYLFDSLEYPNGHISRKMVIDRIRSYIKKHKSKEMQDGRAKHQSLKGDTCKAKKCSGRMS